MNGDQPLINGRHGWQLNIDIHKQPTLAMVSILHVHEVCLTTFMFHSMVSHFVSALQA
ncbi:MAG: hypothetical protein RDU30_01995 [Desulfovibrionaceae bacterium]|nr:hypothetical protein [Desulfovibrionaceae bacterium]